MAIDSAEHQVCVVECWTVKNSSDSFQSLCTGLFLAMLDSTIVATALYTIGVDFNSLTSITWVALAYTVRIQIY